MAVSPTSVSPAAAALWKLTEATKRQSVTTLASSIIIASGRTYSIQEALDIVRDIEFAMFPAPNDTTYKEWEKTKRASLKKVYGPS